MTTSEDRQRLAVAFNRRLDELGMTRAELSRRSGIVVRTISKIANATQDSYQSKSTAPIERELGWPPGTINDVLAGGELPAGEVQRPPMLEDDVADLRRDVEDLKQTVASMTERVDRLTSLLERWLRDV